MLALLRTLAAATLVAAAGLAAGACDVEGECTLIGCEDGVTAEIGGDVLAGATGTVTVRTCLDGDCREHEFPPGPSREGLLTGVHPEGLEPGDEVTVTVEVTDASGARLADHTEQVVLARVQPNGPGCPPVCATAGVTVGEPPP